MKIGFGQREIISAASKRDVTTGKGKILKEGYIAVIWYLQVFYWSGLDLEAQHNVKADVLYE